MTQRKGQFIYNLLRPSHEFENQLGKVDDLSILKYKAYVADRLFNITDEQFDKFMTQLVEFNKNA